MHKSGLKLHIAYKWQVAETSGTHLPDGKGSHAERANLLSACYLLLASGNWQFPYRTATTCQPVLGGSSGLCTINRPSRHNSPDKGRNEQGKQTSNPFLAVHIPGRRQ